MKNWLNSLMGKSNLRSNTTPGMMQPEEAPPVVTNTQKQEVIKKTELEKKSVFEEDSVLHDLKTLTGFLGRKVGILSAKADEKVGKVKASSKAMRLIKLSILIGVIFAILYMVFNYIRNAQEKRRIAEEEAYVEEEKATPTPVNYSPFTPSKYADVPEILLMEEQIEALEKEISRTNLRDTSIFPPVVDYNIHFEK